jgi:hypothetical protein
VVAGPRSTEVLGTERPIPFGTGDSFTFRTTLPSRRRLDPRLVKAAILGALVVLGVGLFAMWVVASERASFTTGVHRVPPEVPLSVPGTEADPALTEADAEEATRVSLAAARAAFTEHRSFLDAGVAELSELEPGYTFVDGPSTTPRIVSVASTAGTWAAAVQGPSGICYWIRATGTGSVAHGIGGECTGAAALSLRAPR